MLHHIHVHSFIERLTKLCYFFFSSRRRPTSFSRDWSSDVCSSDLRGGYSDRGNRPGGGGYGDRGGSGGGFGGQRRPMGPGSNNPGRGPGGPGGPRRDSGFGQRPPERRW